MHHPTNTSQNWFLCKCLPKLKGKLWKMGSTSVQHSDQEMDNQTLIRHMDCIGFN